jgi:sRNA-binding protein
VSAARRRADRERARLIIAALAVRFPKTFCVYQRERKPLKIGINGDVITASARGLASGALTARALGIALSIYVRNIGYLKNCKPGAARIDLRGNVAGHVTVDEAAYAAALIAKAKKPTTVTTKPTGKNKPRRPVGTERRGSSTVSHENNTLACGRARPAA